MSGTVRLNHRIDSRHRRFLEQAIPSEKSDGSKPLTMAKCPTPEVVFSSRQHATRRESDHYTSCVMKYPLSKDVYSMYSQRYDLHDLEAKEKQRRWSNGYPAGDEPRRDPLAPEDRRPDAARPGGKQRRRLTLHDDRDAAARKAKSGPITPVTISPTAGTTRPPD